MNEPAQHIRVTHSFSARGESALDGYASLIIMLLCLRSWKVYWFVNSV